MDGSGVSQVKEVAVNLDAFTEEEYASQSKLYKEFTSMSTIDKVWTFKSSNGLGSQVMFSTSQPNLLANKKKKLMLSSAISEDSHGDLNVQWSSFPTEVTGASLMVPSPSGSKLLVVRNPEDDSATQFEIWGPFQLEKEIRVPQSVHGSVYADGWFEGVSWSSDESLIAYVAKEPSPNQHVMIWVTKKTMLPLTRIVVAGKVKGIGKRIGVKPIFEKGSPLFRSEVV